MKKLRRDFERLCYNHRSAGIPNLMLYIAIGNVIVYFFSLIDPSQTIYNYLYFSRVAILRGQVWRLVSYVFTYLNDSSLVGSLFSFIVLFCYWQIGRMLEQQWGTLRFNLYYFFGVLLLDAGALLLGCDATIGALNLTLFLALATLIPDMRFLLYFIIPIKAKYLAWFYFAVVLYDLFHGIALMIRGLGMGIVDLSWLFPVIALANYFLFFGRDVMNVMPDFIRYRKQRKRQAQFARQNPAWTVTGSAKTTEKTYHHKCTVCGRTDADYPALEFRYCSRCKGFYCYCMDHINNHVHIQ